MIEKEPSSRQETSPRKRKVRCADCAFYKFIEGLKDEPLGGCENDDVLAYALVMDYVGKNWRLNHRNSNSFRRCKGFKPRNKK